MAALDAQIIEDLTNRLHQYVALRDGYVVDKFLQSGGSAAVYKVRCGSSYRAIKIYEPTFFSGTRGQSERRRLDVQRRLIGHKCEELIKVYSVTEEFGTAFIEMEFVDWPRLDTMLHAVPDEQIATLIRKLVTAAKYLESLEIVHRDIKPENIHVSSDFSKLVLLDLGVAREFQLVEEESITATDHGALRPFVATAQYSSPDYLFRLDEPSPALWKALSIYQVGAVLHDLIMRKPMFDTETKLGNRWLLTRAVLTKIPSFAEADAQRLLGLKALAARCLSKDLQTRLQLVGWDDFFNDTAIEPIAALKGYLGRARLVVEAQTGDEAAAKLRFEQRQCVNRIRDAVRAELIAACGTSLPPSVKAVTPEHPNQFEIEFYPNKASLIRCNIDFEWQQEFYKNDANVYVRSTVSGIGGAEVAPIKSQKLCGVAHCGGESEDALVHAISNSIAVVVQNALEMLQAGS